MCLRGNRGVVGRGACIVGRLDCGIDRQALPIVLTHQLQGIQHMCGLFGFAGNLDVEKRRTLLRALCLLNQSRGEDSIGIACVNSDTRKFSAYRVCVPPINAIGKRRFVEICDDSGHVWIGHTRYATRGTVSRRNAHPFHIGNVLGAHNGVVSVTSDLIQRCDRIDYPVDSQYLFYLLNRDGKIGEISGSAALVFCELKQAHDVSLVRHNNPLHVVSINRGEGIVWASERDHLMSALALAEVRRSETVKLQDGDRLDVYLGADGSIADLVTRDNEIDSVWSHIPIRQSGAYRPCREIGFASNPPQMDLDAQEDRYGDSLERLERLEWWNGLSNHERVELAAEWNCEVADLPFYLDIDDSPMSIEDDEIGAWDIED